MNTTPIDGQDRADEVIGVLCNAFADYPIMRYVLGKEGDYAARLRTLIGFFAGARFLRKDAIIGDHAGPFDDGVSPVVGANRCSASFTCMNAISIFPSSLADGILPVVLHEPDMNASAIDKNNGICFMLNVNQKQMY